MNDLISRQAAIDALEKEKSLIERPITETRWFDLGLGKAQEVLSGLPSAQPDIIDAIEEYLQLKEKNKKNNGLSSKDCSRYLKLQKYIRDNITDALSNGYTLICPKKENVNTTVTNTE